MCDEMTFTGICNAQSCIAWMVTPLAMYKGVSLRVLYIEPYDRASQTVDDYRIA